MYKINVKVESNKVDIISKTMPVTTGSLNTIKCVFDLPQEYEDLSCVAVFTCIDREYREIILDNECIIPKEVLEYDGRVKLGVYAFKGEELMYSPSLTGFRIEMGSYTEKIEETEDTQNSFNKIVEKANEIYLKIQKVDTELDNKVSEIEEKLENGEFNGQDGFSPTIIEKVNDDDTYILEITDKNGAFETVNLKGKDGINGTDGKDGENGRDGRDGVDGVDGQDGFSPSITVKNDTDEEYILKITNKDEEIETPNLKGKTGLNGKDGADGKNGANGKSAYEIAVDLGFEGTEQEWLDSLKAEGETSDIKQDNIFYWDGLSSDENPKNIERWQEIFDKAQKQAVLVFSTLNTATSNSLHGAWIINQNLITNSNVSKTSMFKGFLNKLSDSISGTKGVNLYASYAVAKITYTNLKVTKVEQLDSGNSSTSLSFLPTTNEYVTNYTPTHDYHPATKKYVDDSIKNSLADISGLTPKIVDELPTIEEANSNTIYLVPVKNAEEPNLYNEYLFINSNFELIGQKDVVNADLSQYAKKEEVPLVYLWDGQDSTQNPDNIQFFQEILDKHLEGKDVVVISQVIHNVRMSQLYTFDKTNQNELISNPITDVGQGADYYQIWRSIDKIILDITEDKISKVTKSTINNGIIKVLSLDSANNVQYFKATRKAQPVSKGYLDDIVGDINALLDEINGEVVGDEPATLEDEIPVEDANEENDINNEEVIEDGNE